MTTPPAFPDLAPTGVSRALLEALIDRHERSTRPRLRTLWSYYRNPMEPAAPSAAGGCARAYRLAQERGLPARVLGTAGAWAASGAALPPDSRTIARKEIVVENDIAWRIHAMVDFLFSQSVRLVSNARDPARRSAVERVLDAVWESSGGIALMQDMALLGHIYGWVDLVVRAEKRHEGTEAQRHEVGSEDAKIEAARTAVRIEVIEPTRGVPILSPADYRRLDAYILRYEREDNAVDDSTAPGSPIRGSAWRSVLRAVMGNGAPDDFAIPDHARSRTTVTEVIAPRERRVYETDQSGRMRLVAAGPSLADPARPAAAGSPADLEPPIAHIQNLSQPFAYEGLSDVEPLIPLQDELNTRLSDRASRVTMCAFKMYLAKGLDGADKLPVAPGIVWSTDNADAQVTSFGGDSGTPSEDRHIDQVREALDKQSGVPPLAAGVVQAKVGNLSSETALRLTLAGLLAKTARKRITYGHGIARASALALEALDALGIFQTDPADRSVRVVWPDPLPRDEKDLLDAAQRKIDLGVPRDRILAELGYAPQPPGEI